MKKIWLVLFLSFYGCAAESPSWNENDFPLKIYADDTLDETDLDYLNLAINLHNSNLGEVLVVTDNFESSNILITKVKNLEQDLGRAIYNSSNYVEIKFKSKMNNVTTICVLAHELGHAMGHVSHTEESRNLMSEIAFCDGTYGLSTANTSFEFYDEFKIWFQSAYPDFE